LLAVQPHGMGDQPVAYIKSRNNQIPIFHSLSRVAKLVHERTLEKEKPSPG
jgi:hypothetical protein